MHYRKNLSESLEEYAARFKLPPEQIRPTWRLQGLRMLGLVPDLPFEEILTRYVDAGLGGPRVAPGLACPTFTPTIGWVPDTLEPLRPSAARSPSPR